MSQDNPIDLFVSHLFSEDGDYLRVFEFLESVDSFYYINVSKPENVPQSGGVAAIKDEYTEQIQASEAVIMLATHFSANLEMMRHLLDIADANEKPVIAIRPFGGMTETDDELVKRVNEHIQWASRDIADAVRRQARLEDTARWDVLDFP